MGYPLIKLGSRAGRRGHPRLTWLSLADRVVAGKRPGSGHKASGSDHGPRRQLTPENPGQKWSKPRSKMMPDKLSGVSALTAEGDGRVST